MIITNYDETWSFMFTFIFIKRYRDIQAMRPFAREEYLMRQTNFPDPTTPTDAKIKQAFTNQKKENFVASCFFDALFESLLLQSQLIIGLEVMIDLGSFGGFISMQNGLVSLAHHCFSNPGMLGIRSTYRSFRVPLAQFGLGVISMVLFAWLIGPSLRGEFVGEGAVVLCCVLVSPPSNTKRTLLYV